MRETEMGMGTHLHIHSTSKFKTQTICVSFLWPLSEPKLPLGFLLSFLLADTCAALPEKKLVLKRLDDLYGASLSITHDPFGSADRLRFRISGIESINEGEDLTEEMLKTLAEFIFRPRIENGEFPPAMFHECMEQAVIAVEEERDDPYYQTYEKAAKNYGGSLRKKILPDSEKLRRITSRMCADWWYKVLSEARVDIQVLGNVDEDRFAALCHKWLPLKERDAKFSVLRRRSGKEAFETISRNVSQSHVVMLFETGIYTGDTALSSVVLGNGVFGSLPVSLLFQNVREARGLCYSIDSRMLSYDGVLRVAAAAKPEKIDEVYEAILAEMERMRTGDFSDDVLEISRRLSINAARSSADIPAAILNSDFRNAICRNPLTMEELIERYRHITKEQIADVFADMKLRSTAVMKEADA